MLRLFQFVVDCGMLGVIRHCFIYACVYFAVDVGSYLILVNLAYYCESCFHVSVVCKFYVKTLELSFPLLGLFKDAKNVELLTVVMMT